MSVERHQDEFTDSVAAYALGALAPVETSDVERHLRACAGCRQELAHLRPAVDALSASAPPLRVPPDLKGRIMAVVEAEADLFRAAGPAADRAAPAARPRGRGRWFPRPVIAAGAATAALALGVAGGVVLVGSDADRGAPEGRVVAARVLSPLGPGTTARVRVEGERATLLVHNIPEPPTERVYQVWLKASGSAPTPAGATFSIRSGSVDIPRAVRSGMAVLVTHEPVGGSRSPTRAPVIVSRPV